MAQNITDASERYEVVIAKRDNAARDLQVVQIEFAVKGVWTLGALWTAAPLLSSPQTAAVVAMTAVATWVVGLSVDIGTNNPLQLINALGRQMAIAQNSHADAARADSDMS